MLPALVISSVRVWPATSATTIVMGKLTVVQVFTEAPIGLNITRPTFALDASAMDLIVTPEKAGPPAVPEGVRNPTFAELAAGNLFGLAVRQAAGTQPRGEAAEEASAEQQNTRRRELVRQKAAAEESRAGADAQEPAAGEAGGAPPQMAAAPPVPPLALRASVSTIWME